MADRLADNSMQAIAQNHVDCVIAARAVSLLSCPGLNSLESCSKTNDASWSAPYLRQPLCQHAVCNGIITQQDMLRAPCCVKVGVCIVTHFLMTARLVRHVAEWFRMVTHLRMKAILVRHGGRGGAGTGAAPPHAGTQLLHGSG